MNGVIDETTIGLGSYIIDIHDGAGASTICKKVMPYGIPYGSTFSADISNLMFAGRCISVDDHVVGSTRVMTCCMAMGQAVGIAASMALDNGECVADVDVQALRAELLRQRAILE
jgi:hypothetical protein